MNKKILISMIFVVLGIITFTQTYTFLFRDAQLYYVPTDLTNLMLPRFIV
jgi:hypothetical protein